jgi:lipopolysaccharide export system permease protein
VYWTLLHRSIFYELTKVFLLAFVGLTGLLLIAGVIAEATRNGLGPAQILAAIPLLIPSTMPYTIPTTTLFATCVVYGRLANDNEILALKAAGVHIVHVVWPAMLLGTLVSALTFFLYLDTIPLTHSILRTQIVSDVDELLYGMLRKDGCIRHPRMNYEVYVKRVQGKKLIDAQFRKKNASGDGIEAIALAKEAELQVDMAHKRINIRMRHCNIIGDNGMDGFFEDKVWPVEIPDEFGAIPAKTRASDMTWAELFENRRKMEAEIADIESDIARHQAQINLGNAPPHFNQHVQQQINEKRFRELVILGIDAERHMRPAFALGCLCFVLVGCPIGVWFHKSDYLSAFITCFLPIVIIYYPLMLCSINMARSGRFFPSFIIWGADAAMMLAALLMFRRLARN